MGCCYSCMDGFKNQCCFCRCKDFIEPDNYDENECYCPNLWAILTMCGFDVGKFYFKELSKDNLCEEIFWFLPRNLSCLSCCSLIVTFTCFFNCCDVLFKDCCTKTNLRDPEYYNSGPVVSQQPQSVFSTNKSTYV